VTDIVWLAVRVKAESRPRSTVPSQTARPGPDRGGRVGVRRHRPAPRPIPARC